MNKQITDKLNELFESVEPAWRLACVQAMRTQAENQHRAWGAKLKGEMPKRGYGTSWRDYCPGSLVLNSVPKAWHEWEEDMTGLRKEFYDLKYKPSESPEQWALKEKLFAEGYYAPDYVQAEKIANDAVDAAKAHFVAKQGKKIANAVGDKKFISIDGKLELNRIVTGFVTVVCEGGDAFTLEMDIITNYRYGANAADRRITVYNQFPARFRAIVLNSCTTKSAGEKWMMAHFAR